MRLTRKLELPSWNDDTAKIAADYLRSRGFADVTTLPGPSLSGKRGSWLGNFTSFDMTKLRATVSVSPSPDGRSITVDLDVNTVGQVITQWNTAVWRIEIAELHRVLLGDEPLDDVWSRFHSASDAAAIRSVLTMMIGGRRLSGNWEAEISRLESGDMSASKAP